MYIFLTLEFTLQYSYHVVKLSNFYDNLQVRLSANHYSKLMPWEPLLNFSLLFLTFQDDHTCETNEDHPIGAYQQYDGEWKSTSLKADQHSHHRSTHALHHKRFEIHAASWIHGIGSARVLFFGFFVSFLVTHFDKCQTSYCIDVYIPHTP